MKNTPSEPPATSFSPREIVSELDRFIVGQNDAKRAVALRIACIVVGYPAPWPASS